MLGLINEKLWIGHFDITSKNGIPAYRNTIVSSFGNNYLRQKFEDLVDIGIYECEKYYPCFQQVLFDDVPPKASISEMVEISKVYSTEESPGFINGILDSVYKHYKKTK